MNTRIPTSAPKSVVVAQAQLGLESAQANEASAISALREAIIIAEAAAQMLTNANALPDDPPRYTDYIGGAAIVERDSEYNAISITVARADGNGGQYLFPGDGGTEAVIHIYGDGSGDQLRVNASGEVFTQNSDGQRYSGESTQLTVE